MHSLFALAPSLVALIAVLGLRLSGLVASALSMLVAGAIWLAAPFQPLTAQQGWNALADAGVLTALVAAMIVPGMLFVEASAKRRALEAMADVVTAMRLSPQQSCLVIAIGLGIMVESLTGMGVSLLVTVPLLLRFAGRREAIGLALVGMSLMPWGALAISGHLGAKLAGVPLADLTPWISRVSGPVAFLLPMLALLFLPAARLTDAAIALISGAALVSGIVTAAWLSGIEIAGVAGGLMVIMVFAALAPSRADVAARLRSSALTPYAALMLAVVAQKLAVSTLQAKGFSPSLSTGRVSFQVLTSPGVALIAATAATCLPGIDAKLVRRVATRAWRPIAAIACFMIAARLAIECGAMSALVQTLAGLGLWPAMLAVIALGAIGGFATGSGMTGNALFMPSAAATGASLGHLPMFAALQNGASGHIAIAALPVAAILLSALPGRRPEDEQLVLRLGLLLGAVHLAVLCATGAVWLHLVR